MSDKITELTSKRTSDIVRIWCERDAKVKKLRGEIDKILAEAELEVELITKKYSEDIKALGVK